MMSKTTNSTINSS